MAEDDEGWECSAFPGDDDALCISWGSARELFIDFDKKTNRYVISIEVPAVPRRRDKPNERVPIIYVAGDERVQAESAVQTRIFQRKPV